MRDSKRDRERVNYIQESYFMYYYNVNFTISYILFN